MNQEKCPICDGSGIINCPAFKNKMIRQKQDIAKILKKEGYSIREIMRLMNYKSPQIVSILLKN